MICTDGYTYERSAIVEWLKTDGLSPITGVPTEICCLNRTLKSVIDTFLEIKKRDRENCLPQ